MCKQIKLLITEYCTSVRGLSGNNVTRHKALLTSPLNSGPENGPLVDEAFPALDHTGGGGVSTFSNRSLTGESRKRINE